MLGLQNYLNGLRQEDSEDRSLQYVGKLFACEELQEYWSKVEEAVSEYLERNGAVDVENLYGLILGCWTYPYHCGWVGLENLTDPGLPAKKLKSEIKQIKEDLEDAQFRMAKLLSALGPIENKLDASAIFEAYGIEITNQTSNRPEDAITERTASASVLVAVDAIRDEIEIQLAQIKWMEVDVLPLRKWLQLSKPGERIIDAIEDQAWRLGHHSGFVIPLPDEEQWCDVLEEWGVYMGPPKSRDGAPQAWKKEVGRYLKRKSKK